MNSVPKPAIAAASLAVAAVAVTLLLLPSGAPDAIWVRAGFMGIWDFDHPTDASGRPIALGPGDFGGSSTGGGASFVVSPFAPALRDWLLAHVGIRPRIATYVGPHATSRRDDETWERFDLEPEGD